MSSLGESNKNPQVERTARKDGIERLEDEIWMAASLVSLSTNFSTAGRAEGQSPARG